MTRGSLGRLEACWRSIGLSPHGHLHPRHPRLRANLSSQTCCYSSHIINSPFQEIKIPNKLIPEVVWEAVDRFPESIAIKCGLTGRSYTFAQIRQLSLRLANSLRKAGFSRGDVVALVLPNCPEYPIALLGILEADLTVSLVNHSYTADEITHQLKDSGSVCIIVAPDNLGVVLSAMKQVEKATHSTPFRRVIAVDTPSGESLPPGICRFSELVADGVDQSSKSVYQTRPTDMALLPYSSGTTGLSKGVCLSHTNIISNILQINGCNSLKINSPDEGEDVLLGLLPFYHIYGLVVILLNCLQNGAQIVTLPKFEQDSFVRALEKEKLLVLMMVPPLILFLGASEKVTPKHLANVRLIFSGAAPLGSSDLEKVKAKLPQQNRCEIAQAYGLTEMSPVALIPSSPCNNLATVGAPVPNTLAKIINPDSGEALGPNQSGELCFKGPQVMLGYHNNPKATADMIDPDGWIRTGDIGYYDNDSHFYIQDRLKELIKVKGFQVPPAELEELLRTHPLVSDVGVIGVSDPRSGEVPVAYIVPQKHKKLTAEQIKEFLLERVSRHKQLADVIFTDSIPKSAAGKILRKDLRELYKNQKKIFLH